MLDYRDYPELSAEFVAAHPIDDPRFEPWLEAWYGAPLSDGWWTREPEDDGLGDDREAFTFFTIQSWLMGKALVERFPLEQLGQSINSILNQLKWLAAPEKGERLMWDAVRVLFFEVFEPYASDDLDQFSEFGGILFMFWDIAGWRPREATELGRKAFLRLIERCLESPNAALQQSALHGIGEYTPWNHEGGGDVPEASRLARRFITKGKTSRPELFDYADVAAKGMVQ